jgi:hypothetical protein
MRTQSVLISLLPLLFLGVALAGESSDATRTLLLQDFENGEVANPDHKTSITTAWAASGTHALKIPGGATAWIENMKSHDWNGYNALRLQFKNPSEEAVTIGLWVIDTLVKEGWWDWHINNFTVAPGEQAVVLDYSGGLWRSQTDNQYRGPIKTPVDVGKIYRFAVSNPSKHDLMLDRVELITIPQISTPGGFAFDFGRRGSMIMGQFHGVFPDTMYAAGSFGFLNPNGRVLSQAMPYPTSMLGDGIAWPAEGFAVDLPGGDYVGLVACERGGFWGPNESAGYTRAVVKADGAVIHEHRSNPSDLLFLFQDTEVASLDEAYDKLVVPAHVITALSFRAKKGRNLFTLEVEGSLRFPLRIAGLILAPATSEGRAFIAAHEQRQREAFATVFGATDRSRRGSDRAAPDKPLVYDILEPGERVYPRDLPPKERHASIAVRPVVPGQVLCLHIAAYAQKPGVLTVGADHLDKVHGNDTTPIANPVISHGRYLPMRPSSSSGSAWIDLNHYRPESACTIGPDLARSILVEYTIPKDAAPGEYASTITLSGVGPTVRVPISVRIAATTLAELPIPVGLWNNAYNYDRTLFEDEATFWRVQEQLLREEMGAGITALTSGGLYQLKDGTLTGDDAIRTIRLAQKYGTVRAIVPYGGFVPSLRGSTATTDFAPLAGAIADLSPISSSKACLRTSSSPTMSRPPMPKWTRPCPICPTRPRPVFAPSAEPVCTSIRTRVGRRCSAPPTPQR